MNDVTLDSILDSFITCDPLMLTLKEHVKILAPRSECVLVYGETGVGKELIAASLHEQSNRIGNFMVVNCAAIPSTLFDSELFGHVKGAFTGAVKDRPSVFELSRDGSLFLDEIGEMPLDVQAKLLRAVQYGKIRRVGENTERDVNCRIITATNRVLEGSDGFRPDLYYRLAEFVLTLTPLRHRAHDIPLIAKSIDPDLPSEFISRLVVHPLKGNVRELTSIIKRYRVLGETV